MENDSALGLKTINLDMAWAKWVVNPEAFVNVTWTSSYSEPLKLFGFHNVPGEPMKEVNGDD